jgi:hypothetical protein
VDPGLLVAALLALFAVVPLLAHPGLPNTADGAAHLMRQAELNQAWRDGLLYPRWAPDLAYGYGMPLFHYAPPLLYQITQLFHLTGLALDAAMKATIIVVLFLYSMGMYLFAREVYSPRAGLLAAAAYLYAPYRLREAYIQGNYGQFWGLAFYPWVLWSFHGLITSERRRYLPLAALSLAGLLLSHNISSMIFAPLLGAYLVFLLVLRRLEPGKSGPQRPGDSVTQEPGTSRSLVSYSPIPRIVAAIALGLGLSAFFWLPAFGERDLIRLSGITTGFFDFRYNFISLAELLALPRPLDLAAVNPYFPLSLGLAQIAFAALALLGMGLHCVLSVRGGRRPAHSVSRVGDEGVLASDAGMANVHAMAHMLFFAVALLVTAFLTMPCSQSIWERVPLLELAEFPWRWLGPAVLCAAVLAGWAMYIFEGFIARRPTPDANRWSLVALGVGLFFAVAVNLFYLFPSQFIPWGTPSPADAVAYEAETGAIGTTSAGEFLPRWADRFPTPETLGADYASGRPPAKLDPAELPEGASATTLAHTARETRLAVSSPVPFSATFRALYWPDWRVSVAGADGLEYHITDVEISQPEGLMRAQLPAGEYQVSLRLFSTPVRRVATIISAIALTTLLGLIPILLVTGKTRGLEDRGAGTRPADSSDWAKGWQAGGVGRPSNLPRFEAIVIAVALVVALLVTRPMADWFRLQSPPEMVHGAQYELRADFDDQVRLLAFDLPAFPGAGPMGKPSDLPAYQVKAGDLLPVVLYWRALAPLATNYSVYVHLNAPDGTTYASADELNPADIPTSRWPPALYVRNPLTLILPADLPPIRYTLTAGLYDSDSGARLPLTGCQGCPVEGDALPLAQVWVSSPMAPDERDIPGRLDYRLGDQITLLGYELVASDPAMLTLYWRAEAPVESAYTVFIHALDADGEVVAQFDAPPLGGLYPTDAWLPGQIIADAHAVAIPESAQGLAVGLYDPASLARLPVGNESGERIADDAVRLQVTGSR